MHISIPKEGTCELLNFTPVNPLISKCQIKVCYVGEKPNRNGSVITKEVATQMAQSLPGCPIVGFFNEAKGDFEEHNRVIEITNNQLKVTDKTRPYGFVDLNAKVWFETFTDDGFDHEYLCTEGYVWTGVYPESKRIITNGNNQSMELHEETLDAHWAYNDKLGREFFIINEAIISKLCILGEDCEPCFEGAGIASKFSLSLDSDFKQIVFNMQQQLEAILKEGGISQMDNEKLNNPNPEQDEQNLDLPTDSDSEFKKKKPEEEEEKKEEKKDEEPSEKKDDEKSDEKPAEKKNPEEKPADEKGDDEEDDEEKKKKNKKKFSYDSLEEISEYVELNTKYAELQTSYNTLLEEVTTLREFKAAADRKQKQDMIDSFYMLSDEDKADVIAKIDTYSLDDIEAKLSIICVRNKVSFNLDEDNDDSKNRQNPTVYTLGDNDDGDDAPAWIKAVRNTMKSM